MKHYDRSKEGVPVGLKLARFVSRVSLTLIALFTCSVIYAQSERITVNGTVVDAQGEPLIGASVIESGVVNGTMTDINGKYTLSVPAAATLDISFVGFNNQSVKVDGRQIIDIVLLEDSKILSEVVVTALGIKREVRALGYSVTELKGDELDINVINPVSALQGKAAGVHISGSDGGLFGSSKIMIRGASTLGKNNQPIYVVDGVIIDNSIHHAEVDFESNPGDYGNEIKNLNANDFETVSILKGAAATALYGSRGLNGAVVVTTKGGGPQSGFGVSINQSFGIEKVNTMPKLQTQFGQGSWATAGATRRQNPWDTSNFELVDGKETIQFASNTYWGPRYDGRDVTGYDGEIIPYTPNKDYYKDMFRTGFSSNSNVVIRGGSGNTSFYNSLGYMTANGVVDNNEFEKLSNMLKASQKVGDRVTVAGSFTFSASKPKNPQLSIGERVITAGIGHLYDTKYYRDKYKGDNHSGIASTNYGDKYGRVPNRGLLWDIYESSDIRKETVMRPTLDVDVNILDWLDFRAGASMNYYFTSREAKRLGTGYMNSGNSDDSGGRYIMDERVKKQETVSGGFLFNKKVSDFNFGGFLRGEFYNYSEKWQSMSTDGGLVVPGKYFIANSKKQVKAQGKYDGKKRILSAIASANMSWKDQLYLDLSGRNDWSSALIKTDGTGDHSFFYPSVSGSWIATETFKEYLPSQFSFAKFRLSWAQVGNDTDAYSIIQGYNIQSILQSNGTNIQGQAVPNRLIQDNIKPERKNAWEVGADIRFFEDRLGVDVTLYKENTKNQIMTIDKAAASGVEKYLINAGNIQNQGVEIALKTVPFRNKDWQWTVDLTYTKNKNKIVELHESSGEYIVLEGYVNAFNFRVGSVAKVGGDYGALMTDIAPARDDKGNKILNYSQGGRAGYYQRANTVQDLGVSINPDFLGSIATGLRWKNISFNALLDFRYGGYIASYSNRYSMAYGLHNNSLYGRDTQTGGITFTSIHDGKVYYDGYIPEGVFGAGAEATPPGQSKSISLTGLTYQEAVDKGYIDPTHASTYHRYTSDWGLGTLDDNWFHKVKYIALREISIAYQMPRPLASSIGARGLRFGVSGRNLGYLYNSIPNNLNPESIRGSSSAEFRERGFSPNRASYTFNIGLDF